MVVSLWHEKEANKTPFEKKMENLINIPAIPQKGDSIMFPYNVSRCSNRIIRIDEKYVYTLGMVGRNSGGVWYPYVYRVPVVNLYRKENDTVSRRVFSTHKGTVLSIAKMKELNFI